MLPRRVCFTPTNRHSSARPSNAKPEDVHLASTIHCVDDEIIKWLPRRERCLCGHPGPDIRRYRVPLRTAGKNALDKLLFGSSNKLILSKEASACEAAK